MLLVLLPGCQLPAARFDPPNAQGCIEARSLALTHQVAVDSALELTHHPVRCGWGLLHETGNQFQSVTRGELGKRLLLPLMGAPDALAVRCDYPTAESPAGELPNPTGKPLQPAGIQLFPGGPEAFAALERVIDQATCSIDVMMFEWEGDPVGGVIAERLAAKAGPHLRVRILEDGGGNLIFGRPRTACCREINLVLSQLAQKPYVEVLRTRNPFARFDHRKLVIVDGRVAWSGGRNLVRRVFYDQHDLSFTVTGPLVTELQQEFEAFWRDQGGAAGEAVAPPCPPSEMDPINAGAFLVYTKPGCHELQRTLYQAVDHAQHYIYAENVYFCDSLLVCKLAQARRRGVDVRVILTVTSTNCVMNCSNRVVANRLLRAGVRVYLYPGMTHVKAAAIDGCWGYVGTANFDALSLRHNYELGVVIAAGPVLSDLDGCVFVPDCRPEWEMKEPLHASAGDYACELLCGVWL